MKKKAQQFICNSCGEIFQRWQGKCSNCNEWNSIEEKISENSSSVEVFKNTNHNLLIPTSLIDIKDDPAIRLKTDLTELDLVLGGGIVLGSFVLIGGEPGVGKSTLLLEIAKNLVKKVKKIYYFSGEESASQVVIRAKRLNLVDKNLFISNECGIEKIIDLTVNDRPDIIFIDSIQTLRFYNSNFIGSGINMLREIAQKLLELSKNSGIPLIVTGHITKDGNIAGPKLLEHLVDVVLYFEGEKFKYYRMLRAVKNRFGEVGELAVFEMQNSGLKEVKNKNELFINSDLKDTTGSVICVSIEGSRPLVVEIQALVVDSHFSQAKRMAEGLDTKRIVLLSAVIEKHLRISLSQTDIFCNLIGGIYLDEPSLDLGICIAIISSFQAKPISKKISAIGEVGLSGEIRVTGQIQRKIKELKNIGIEKILIPEGNLKEVEKISIDNLKLVGISNLKDLNDIFKF